MNLHGKAFFSVPDVEEDWLLSGESGREESVWQSCFWATAIESNKSLRSFRARKLCKISEKAKI